MLSLTKKALEEFDNQHDFERMCADILNGLGCTNVTPVAPRGGGDDGKDITYGPSDNKCLACISLEKSYKSKFLKDFKKHKAGDFQEYAIFSNQYITATDKKELAKYCLDKLDAQCTIRDQEALRSLLDVTFQEIRERYLDINISEKNSFMLTPANITRYRIDEHVLVKAKELLATTKASPELRLMDYHRMLGFKNKSEKIQLLERYVSRLTALEDKLNRTYSFNIELISTAKNDDVEVRVRCKDNDALFTFDEGDMELPDEPQIEGAAISPLRPPFHVPKLDNITPLGLSSHDFYAVLTENDKVVQCNVSSLNADHPKQLFDCATYVVTKHPLDNLELRVEVYSSKLKNKLTKNLSINLSSSRLEIITEDDR